MKPLYKVNDLVLIKKNYDQNCTEYNYRFVFTQIMLERYGGTVQVIEEINETAEEGLFKLSDDTYRYTLKNIYWNWSSSMFEPEF